MAMPDAWSDFLQRNEKETWLTNLWSACVSLSAVTRRPAFYGKMVVHPALPYRITRLKGDCCCRSNHTDAI